jgi:hypothetical protein
VSLVFLFFGSALQTYQGLTWFKLILPLILVASLYTVTSRQQWQVGTLLAAPALVANWLNVLTQMHTRSLILIEGCFGILFLSYTVWVILTGIFAETDVTLVHRGVGVPTVMRPGPCPRRSSGRAWPWFGCSTQ